MDLTKKDLIYATTFGLHTKFIEAEREHNCEKIQVSPICSDPPSYCFLDYGKRSDCHQYFTPSGSAKATFDLRH